MMSQIRLQTFKMIDFVLKYFQKHFKSHSQKKKIPLLQIQNFTSFLNASPKLTSFFKYQKSLKFEYNEINDVLVLFCIHEDSPCLQQHIDICIQKSICKFMLTYIVHLFCATTQNDSEKNALHACLSSQFNIYSFFRTSGK